MDVTDEERVKLFVELTTAVLILIREIRELSERLAERKEKQKPRKNRPKPRKRKR